MKTKIIFLFSLTVSFLYHAQYLKVNGKVLNDANGIPIILRGINYPILDDGDVDFNTPATYQTKINEFAKTGANTIRIPWNTSGKHWRDAMTPGTLQSYVDNGKLAAFIDYCSSKNLYTILEIHDITCTNNWTAFNNEVMAFWKQNAIKNLINNREGRVIINIANEFGTDANWGGNNADFANNYATAVTALRTEGYRVPIMIDAPNCGMASTTLTNVASTIYNADNLKNIMFSVHTYWIGYANNNVAIDAKMLEMYNSPYYFFLGEIANLQDVGSCGDTDITNIYKRVLTKACEYNIGWLAWSYFKDCASQRQMTTTGMFANLTTFGNDIVNNATYGLKSTSCGTTLKNNESLDLESNDIVITPNPVKEEFSIITKNDIESLNLVDLSAKKVFIKDVAKNKYKINAPNGVYMLNMKTKKGNFNKKIIIQR